MGAFILHQGATVLCSHAGQAMPTAPNPRVMVSHQPVVTQPTMYTIVGCPFPPPPAGNGPCLTAMWVSAATRVRVGGMPVLTQSSQAICAPTGTPLQIVATQTRVQAQ